MEKSVFSPILKKWHSFAAGVAVATLHTCYRSELKQFMDSLTDLTPENVQILKAADKLEKDLVLIAVEDYVDSDDGGKAIIREMPPYEAETKVDDLARNWIKTRVDTLKGWIDRNLQQENGGGYMKLISTYDDKAVLENWLHGLPLKRNG